MPVPPDDLFHPEFGYLCPTPRLRLGIRVGLVTLLCGALAGMIVTLIATSRPASNRAIDSAENTPALAAEASALPIMAAAVTAVAAGAAEEPCTTQTGFRHDTTCVTRADGSGDVPKHRAEALKSTTATVTASEAHEPADPVPTIALAETSGPKVSNAAPDVSTVAPKVSTAARKFRRTVQRDRRHGRRSLYARKAVVSRSTRKADAAPSHHQKLEASGYALRLRRNYWSNASVPSEPRREWSGWSW
jgi:hypothetical protein